jgi:nitroreductase
MTSSRTEHDHPILPQILARRSVRRFADRPVEREKLLACVDAARLAPSAENSQPSRFILIDDPAVKKAFGEKAFSGVYRATRWTLDAPALVVLAAKPDFIANRLGRLIQGTPFWLVDIGIAGEHFVLQAQSMGLGTCWIGWFSSRKAGRFLRLPPGVRAAMVLAVGYPAKGWTPGPLRRLDNEAFFSWNAWKK